MAPEERARLGAYLDSLGAPWPEGEAPEGDLAAWFERASGRPAFELWGKAQPDTQQRWPAHPLLCHLLDVAAVASRLLTRFAPPALAGRLLRIDADPRRALRLLLFIIALHDLGKATPAFQAKVASLLVKLLSCGYDASPEPNDLHHSDAGFVPAQNELIALGLEGDAAGSLARAVTAHHGQFPLNDVVWRGQNARQLGRKPRWGQARGDVVNELCALFDLGPSSAPSPPPGVVDHAYVILLAGLTSVADWVGSMAEVFGYEAPPTSLRAYWRLALERADRALQVAGFSTGAPARVRGFTELFPHFSSRWPLHEVADKLAPRLDGPSLVIVEAPMGEGKTEAALLLAEASAASAGQRGLYIGLPTQATANQMFGRVHEFLTRSHPGEGANLMLAHGEASLVKQFADLRLASIYDAASESTPRRPGANESPERGAVRAEAWFLSKKRALLADWAVGTIDQALLSVMRVPHGFVRLYGLAGKAVVLDEVHAYDTYTGTLLDRLLEWLASVGATVIMLSATLPRHRREELYQAYAKGRGLQSPAPPESVGYPRITYVSGAGASEQTFKPRGNPLTVTLEAGTIEVDAIVERALTELDKGGCIGCVFNTVGRAQEAYRLARERRPGLGHHLLLHARIFPDERNDRERRLESWLGPESDERSRPERALVIGTQVLEQSLDVDFDLLLTDLAPIDLVLQRAGRLFRHLRKNRSPAHPAPRLVVASPAPDDKQGLRDVAVMYPPLLLRRTLQALADCRNVALPTDIEPLVERVYGPHDLPAADDPDYKDFIDFLGKSVIEKKLAKPKLLPSPRVEDDPFGSLKVFLDDDDDPLLHQELRAATRLGRPSVEIVCIERTPSGSLTLGDGVNVSLDREPTRPVVERVVRRSIGVSRPAVVQALLKTDPPKAWQKSALLRYRRLVCFENGQAEVGGVKLSLDAELGLVLS